MLIVRYFSLSIQKLALIASVQNVIHPYGKAKLYRFHGKYFLKNPRFPGETKEVSTNFEILIKFYGFICFRIGKHTPYTFLTLNQNKNLDKSRFNPSRPNPGRREKLS